MSLTAEQSLWAYATLMNTLDASSLEPLLADDFHYASQWVFAEIESKRTYVEYIVPKLDAIRKSGTRSVSLYRRRVSAPQSFNARACIAGTESQQRSPPFRLGPANAAGSARRAAYGGMSCCAWWTMSSPTYRFASGAVATDPVARPAVRAAGTFTPVVQVV